MDWNAILADCNKPTIILVNDEYCPSCREPGNPKVCDEKGRWHWKCSTPGCDIAYFLPGTNYTEKRLSPEADAEMTKRIHDEVTDMLKGRIWIEQTTSYGSVSKTIAEGDPIPDGWHALGSN